MTEPVRVLHIANFSTRLGGGEESLLALVRGLDRRRFAPHVVVPGEGDVAAELRRDSIPVTVLAFPPLRPWTVVSVLSALRDLRACIGTLGIGLVHAHGSRAAFYAGVVVRRARVPLVWHVRIVERDPLLDGLLLSLSTRVIVNSQAVGARFGGSGNAWKVRVVYNGVDPDYWAPMQPARSARPGPTVLLVGRLMEAKGQRTLLRAAPAILQRFPATRFVFVGRDSGDEGDQLRALSRQLGIQDAVEFREWLADPRAVYGEADVLVLPSRSEGFGRVLVEAACLTKPVVASRVGGVPEVVVNRETGLLVEPDDVGALANALITLLGDATLRASLGAAARRRALERFTVRHHVAGVEAVYGEALEHAHPAPRSAPSEAG